MQRTSESMKKEFLTYFGDVIFLDVSEQVLKENKNYQVMVMNSERQETFWTELPFRFESLTLLKKINKENKKIVLVIKNTKSHTEVMPIKFFESKYQGGN